MFAVHIPVVYLHCACGASAPSQTIASPPYISITYAALSLTLTPYPGSLGSLALLHGFIVQKVIPLYP